MGLLDELGAASPVAQNSSLRLDLHLNQYNLPGDAS
jgi:hypothetical protein